MLNAARGGFCREHSLRSWGLFAAFSLPALVGLVCRFLAPCARGACLPLSRSLRSWGLFAAFSLAALVGLVCRFLAPCARGACLPLSRSPL